ncbi:MAG: amidohydrolase family protein [Pyrinomonadaceae bacterium]
MFTLIENGEVYSPEPIGKVSVLIANDHIVKIGETDARALKNLGVEHEVIDASDCVVTPGFIDPHQHLLGGSGEEGFASQTPEISLSEIVSAGITTVVGCLGADTRMKTLPGLLAKVKGLEEEGLNARMWSGGYRVPPTSITDSVSNDIMFIDEVIGTGEIAIADERSSDPTVQEFARIAHETYLAGMLASKAGLVHIHVGNGEERLKLLRDVIKQNAVRPEWLYVTHISRSEKLMNEAIELAKNGSFVDIDTVDENLAECLNFYIENYGWEEKLTISSDASKTGPRNLFEQVRSCVNEHGFALERVLPFVTYNTACALKLKTKGQVAEGKIADILVMRREGLELVEVLSRGRRMFREGKLSAREKFLEDSNRSIELHGSKNGSSNGEDPYFETTQVLKTSVDDSVMCKEVKSA